MNPFESLSDAVLRALVHPLNINSGEGFELLSIGIPTLLERNNEHITFHDNFISKIRIDFKRILYPEQSPFAYRIKNQTYSAKILVDIRYILYNYDNEHSLPKRHDLQNLNLTQLKKVYDYLKQNVVLVEIPVTINPKYIYNANLSTDIDTENTFIIQGRSRYIPAFTTSENNTSQRLYINNTHILQIRSMHPSKPYRSSSTFELQLKDPTNAQFGLRNYKNLYCIKLRLPYFNQLFPVALLIIIYNYDIKKIIELLYRKNMICGNINHSQLTRYCVDLLMYQNTTKENAIERCTKYYGKTIEPNKLVHILYSEFLSQLNTSTVHDYNETPYKKINQLIEYIYELICMNEKYIPPTIQNILIKNNVQSTTYLYGVLIRRSLLEHYRQSINMFKKYTIIMLEVFKAYDKEIMNHKGHDTKLTDTIIDHGKTNNKKQPLKITPQYIDKQLSNYVSKAFSDTRFTNKLITALATGKWSKKILGVCHLTQSGNDNILKSQLRRIHSGSLHAEGNHLGPRKLQCDTYGYKCAAETPDGQHTGLIGNSAITCLISSKERSNINIEIELMTYKSSSFVKQCPNPPIIPKSNDTKHFPTNSSIINNNNINKIYTIFDGNFNIYGYTTDINEWINIFHQLKSNCEINPDCTYSIDNELCQWYLRNNRGRLIRPLYSMDKINHIRDENISKLNGLLSINGHYKHFIYLDMVLNGIIQHVCAGMEQYNNVYMTYRDYNANYMNRNQSTTIPKKTLYNYLEISMISFLGILASKAPLFRHNQSPRLIYWLGMEKQLIDSTTIVDPNSSSHLKLWHSHRPIVRTKFTTLMGMENNHDCTNVTIMLLPHPCNQEDAIVVSKRSIQHGLFIHRTFKKYIADSRGMNKHIFINLNTAPNVEGRKKGSYKHIDENGMPIIGNRVYYGDVIIGRARIIKKNNNKQRQNVFMDDSITMKQETGIIAAYDIQNTSIGQYCIVHISYVSMPEIGDKLSSRHAQKGVIGKIIPPDDMYYSLKTGITPDIIFSPLGLTSRMTIGNILELLIGKAACISKNTDISIDKQRMDTPINGELKNIKHILSEYGFLDDGTERFMNGKTGKIVECNIMTGVVSYVKLKHLCANKFHARGAIGPVHYLTKQPTEGKKANGGLRIGTMEVECLNAHGVSRIMRERLLTSSDKTTIPLCNGCGLIAVSNPIMGYSYCKSCNSKDLYEADVGYSSKLMLQELASTGIKISLHHGEVKR